MVKKNIEVIYFNHLFIVLSAIIILLQSCTTRQNYNCREEGDVGWINGEGTAFEPLTIAEKNLVQYSKYTEDSMANSAIYFYIEDILQKVEYGTEYLYVFCTGVQIKKSFSDTIVFVHKHEDYGLAISHNEGTDWELMDLSDETLDWLYSNYPKRIINKVKGYFQCIEYK